MPQELLQKQCIGFLKTPPIWKGKQFGIQQFEFPEMDLADFIPEHFPKNIRLGHQMEHVFKQLIEHSKRYEILVHNLPIRDENRTLGEIDFILKDVETGQLIHVELTYKFYVVDLEIEEPIHQLIGPNRGDAFFSKLQKIKNKQFELLHTPEASKALNLNTIDHTKIIHQVCYKTQLFMPKSCEQQLISPLNAECVYGYWLPYKNFNSAEYSSFQFYIPTKSEWVNHPHQKIVWSNYLEIKTEINQSMEKRKSPMIWMRKSATEFEKFFVVWW